MSSDVEALAAGEVPDGPPVPAARAVRADRPVAPAPADGHGAPVRAPTTVELFERAARAHAPRLLAIARAIVGRGAVAAEDVVQQALLNLYRHRERYDWLAPAGLLRRTVVNEALRVLRQPRMMPVGEYDDLHAGREPTPVGGMIDRETVVRVRAAIDRLPDHFRAALVLCEYEGLAYTEIAAALGCSVPQVKTWLHRGRRQLARMLEKDWTT